MIRPLILLASAALCVLGAVPAHSAAPSDVALVRSRSLDAARALGRLYDATNDGAYEAYVARALSAHAAIGRSERCRLPSGRLSRRPTVIANPPLARSSVAQREHLLAAIGAYEATLVALAEKAGPTGVAVAESDLQRELADLTGVANAHAQGDLFIEDATKNLSDGAERLMRAGDSAAQERAINAMEPTIRKLLAILADDAARQRIDSVDAAALAYRGWTSFERQTVANAAAIANQPNGDVPACSEPAIYARGSRGAGNVPDAPSASASPEARTERARQRLDAVRAANPATLLSVLSALDDSELRLLNSLDDVAAAAAAKNALDRFDAVARDFAAPFELR